MPPDDAATPGARSTRATPRLLFVAAAVLLLLRIGVGVYQHFRPPRGFDRVSWIDATEFYPPLNPSKPVLYDFTAEWCPPCQQMKRELFADRKLAAQIDEWFTPVRVLDRSREDGRNLPVVDALQARHGVDAFPTLVVIYGGGRPSQRQVGYPGRLETTRFLENAHYNSTIAPDSVPAVTGKAAAADSAARDSQPPPRPRRGRARSAH